jgi:peptide-methionine (S)-S-oxide reductase
MTTIERKAREARKVPLFFAGVADFASLGTRIERNARKTSKANLFFASLAAFAFLVVAAAGAQPQTATATFAGGCFWSMEHVFDDLPGVVSVTVGYAGGSAKNPTYERVEMGVTGHAESVQVVFDPKKITYDALLDAYWHNIDPTDGAGQFCDHGTQYRPIIFYADEDQKRLAEQSKAALEQSHRFKRVMPQIVTASTFWRGEEAHQHFYKTHAAQYRMYRAGCGRDARLRELWGKTP